jgi:protein-tyrosine phosphatase
MRGTIDLRCHLLHGIDDAARDLADAVAMAKQAKPDGIAAICATPTSAPITRFASKNCPRAGSS